MQDLIKLVSDNTGISTAQTTMAVEMVAGFIKQNCQQECKER